MKKQAFDSELYLNLQRDKILNRISQFSGKLYMEFGGKMFNVTPLCLTDWIAIIVVTSLVLWVGELLRLINRK